MRRIVLTADDFGMTASVNAAVARAHRDGVLTHASLMVNGAAVEEAVAITRENPTLSVGIHLTMVKGIATLPPCQIPDLVNERGQFLASPTAAGWRYFLRRAAREQLRRELRAQVEKFLAVGLRPSHLDSHCHLHLHPTVWPMVVDLAHEFGIPRIRLPQESVGKALRLQRHGWARKLTHGAIFGALGTRARRQLSGNNGTVNAANGVMGLMHTGRMDEQILCGLLEHLPSQGEFEIFFHPDTKATTENPNGPTELATLLSRRVREFLARAAVVPEEELALAQ